MRSPLDGVEKKKRKKITHVPKIKYNPILFRRHVGHEAVMVRYELQRAEAPHLGPLGLVHLDADADALQALDLDAAAEQDLVQPGAPEPFLQLGVALIPPRVALGAVLLPARLEVGVFEAMHDGEGAVEGLDGVEIAGQDGAVDGGRVAVLGGFGELGGPQGRRRVEAFQVGVAEAQDALVGRRWFGGDVDVEPVTIHLRVLVKGAEHAREGQAPVDEGGGSVVGRFPVEGVGVGEGKASADPGSGLQEQEVVAHHFLKEDDQGQFAGEGVDEAFEVAQGADHAKRPALGLGVNVPCDEANGGDRRGRELFVERLPAATGEGVGGLRHGFRVRVGHVELGSCTHDWIWT